MFVRVVEANSFRKAALSLGAPRSTVTMAVQRLEEHLGVRLIHRTTRSIKLSADGEAYYDRCRSIIADVEAAESGLRDGFSHVRGRLRVSMPAAIGRMLVIPSIDRFRHLHPDIELRIGMTDRLVDLVEEGIDCVIRTGELTDSSLISRKIGEYRWVICAAPSYLDRRGEPKAVEDLRNHQAVAYASPRDGRSSTWSLRDGGGETIAEVAPSIIVDETFALKDLALAGYGLVRISDFMIRDELRSGALREVLPHTAPAPVPIWLLYPSSRQLAPAVRAFADWAQSTMADGATFSRNSFR